MKEFTITIGSSDPKASPAMRKRERRLAFTSLDGKAIKKRFSTPLVTLFLRDVLGANDDGKLVGLFDPEVQQVVMAIALTRGGAKGVTEDVVGAWFQDHVDGGGSVIADFAIPLVQAAFYSGIVNGRRTEIGFEDDDETEEGKAQSDPEPVTAE